MNEELIKAHGITLLDLIEETSRVFVWKAVQTTLDRSVFLVILKDGPSSDPEETKYFLHIAQQFAKLKSESVSAIFDIVSEENLHYIIMEHVEGDSLDEIVQKSGPLSFNRVMQVATSVTGSLKQLWHNSAIIHRNLKGSTIRFDARGIAKLMDFSLAVIDKPDFNPEVIDKGHVLGAPSYLSPEQSRGDRHLTIQSDMYALGALLYYISTGKPPFCELEPEEILSAHISESLKPPHQITRGVPVNFSRMLYKLMMKDPEYRYQNWEEVHHDLHCILDGREPVCANLDLLHLSTINPDFSEGVFKDEAQQISVKIKPKKRNEYLAGIQDKHVSQHHEADEKSRAFIQQLIWWGILGLWFVILFWFRTVIQVNPDKKQELIDKGKQFGTVFNNFIPGSDSAPVSNEQKDVKPVPAAKIKVAATTSPDVADSEPIPDGLLLSLAQAFKIGNLDVAVTALSSAQPEYTEKSKLLALLKSVPSADDLVAKHLQKNIGLPLIMNFKGKPRKVVPKGVNNNVVQLEANGKSIDFSISKLTPEQKSNWIDPPQTVEEHIAFCLLLLQTPRADEVGAYADNCGALASAVRKATEL